LRGLTSSDELANLAESLRFILERADCHVRHASDGEQALQAVRSERPDVMILDVMLPSLNGFDVLKTIRADSFSRRKASYRTGKQPMTWGLMLSLRSHLPTRKS